MNKGLPSSTRIILEEGLSSRELQGFDHISNSPVGQISWCLILRSLIIFHSSLDLMVFEYDFDTSL